MVLFVYQFLSFFYVRPVLYFVRNCLNKDYFALTQFVTVNKNLFIRLGFIRFFHHTVFKHNQSLYFCKQNFPLSFLLTTYISGV